MSTISLLCLTLTLSLLHAQTTVSTSLSSTDYPTLLQQLNIFKGFTYKMSQTLSFIKEGVSKQNMKDYARNELQAIEMDANETERKSSAIYEVAQYKSNFNFIQMNELWIGVKEVSLECLMIRMRIKQLLDNPNNSTAIPSATPPIPSPILIPRVIPALDKSQDKPHAKNINDYLKMYEKVEDEIIQIVDELINFCRVAIKPNIKDYSEEEMEELTEMLNGFKGVEYDLSEVLGEIEDSDDLSASDEAHLNKMKMNLLNNLQSKRRMVYNLIHFRSGRYSLMQEIISINPVGSLLH